MKEAKISVQYRSIKELKLLDNNPRIIKKKQLETLKQSLRDNPDFFEARPIILSDRTGELVVIAGNQRMRAAMALNIEEVPTVLIPNLTEEREKEIIIRDNVSNGEWDFDLLANNWDENKLAEWGLDGALPKIDWASVEDLSDETYDEPEHDKLECPKCGHIDRKIHFKAVKES